MRLALRIVLLGALVLGLLASMAVAALLVFVLPQEVLGTITVNGEAVNLRADARHWLLATGGVALAAVVLLVVVPLVAVCGLLAGALSLLATLVGALVMLALLLAPVLLVALLVRALLRRGAKHTTIAP